jgi:hypothetical protein
MSPIELVVNENYSVALALIINVQQKSVVDGHAGTLLERVERVGNKK